MPGAARSAAAACRACGLLSHTVLALWPPASLPLQVCERVLLELNPATSYTFPSFHKKIEEPYNYYLFGQRYIRWVGCTGRRVSPSLGVNKGVGGLGLSSRLTSGLGGATLFKTPCPDAAHPPTPPHPTYPPLNAAAAWLTLSTVCWATLTALRRSSGSSTQVGDVDVVCCCWQ